jgi:hypothetical protein
LCQALGAEALGAEEPPKALSLCKGTWEWPPASE